jgi:hypothetical protein
MLIILPLVGLLGLALTVGAVLVIRDSIRQRGNWGIHFKSVSCPLCGYPAPVPRVPKNWRQALWGGCTCPKCGLEYDKWGRAVDENERLRRLDELDEPYARPRPGDPDDRIKPPGRISKDHPNET